MDAKPLLYLKDKCSTSAKLLRWSLRLAEYDFEINHLKGVNMITSDFLSRYIDYQGQSDDADAVGLF